jgi:nucleotide-binding universal stress UspA family protein
MNPIICVTEFSDHTPAAFSAASAMARRWNERLLLVRSVDEREQFPLPTRESLVHEDRVRLAREAAAFRAAGLDCEEHVLLGSPEESIAVFAQRVQASLVVLGCPPLSRVDTWVLGCTAEQIALTTHVPLLLVRSESPFTEWVAGRKALRVYAFVDPVDHSPAIARAIEEWRAVAEEEVEFHDTPADAARHPHDAANRCAQAARAADADLLVVSTHPRKTLPLLPHPSLAGYLLREAPMSILVVPDTSVPHVHATSAGSREAS